VESLIAQLALENVAVDLFEMLQELPVVGGVWGELGWLLNGLLPRGIAENCLD
jgi:hypothetical protein